MRGYAVASGFIYREGWRNVRGVFFFLQFSWLPVYITIYLNTEYLGGGTCDPTVCRKHDVINLMCVPTSFINLNMRSGACPIKLYHSMARRFNSYVSCYVTFDNVMSFDGVFIALWIASKWHGHGIIKWRNYNRIALTQAFWMILKFKILYI